MILFWRVMDDETLAEKRRLVKNKIAKSTGLPQGHRLEEEKDWYIFYQPCLWSDEGMERNNKWRRLFRRQFYLKTSVSTITPQKQVLLCVHACVYQIFVLSFAICRNILWVFSFSAGIISLFLFSPFPVCWALTKSYSSEILAVQKQQFTFKFVLKVTRGSLKFQNRQGVKGSRRYRFIFELFSFSEKAKK